MIKLDIMKIVTLSATLILLIIILIFYTPDHTPYEYKYENIEAKVIDKHYQPSSLSSNSGVVLGSGQVVSGSTYIPEKWTIIYKELKSKKVGSKEVDAKVYYKYNIGDTMIVDTKKIAIPKDSAK